ncbi:hypothetical protein J437_LFUL011239 [Ladona fulva]|uniref:C2H2-type domain-containing protein n=1 Tax=Ladona fulva TaxID=123851 RepID=A0A8K0KDF3_LADFU|nr:hypothetical protein J437_LFUL011239 [Ladona fulva]
MGTHLKNHKKVHTGEKPHRCDVCDVGFSDRFALKRHKGVHGGNTSAGGPSAAPTPGSEGSGGAPETPTQQQQTGPLELYKCEVGQVAFPGCSRPPEKPLHTG